MKHYLNYLLTAFFAVSVIGIAYADVVVIQEKPQLTDNGSIYPDQPAVIKGWKLITPVPVTEPTVPVTQDYSNYYKKPYSDPNLAKQYANSPVINGQTIQDIPEEQQYQQNMQDMCQHYLDERRAQNFTTGYNNVMDRTVYDRDVVSFKNFAESCEAYINSNRIYPSSNLVPESTQGEYSNQNFSIPPTQGTPVGEF